MVGRAGLSVVSPRELPARLLSRVAFHGGWRCTGVGEVSGEVVLASPHRGSTSTADEKRLIGLWVSFFLRAMPRSICGVAGDNR